MPIGAPLAHVLLAGLAIIGYVVLTALGHDGTLLLGFLVGQGATAAVQATAAVRTGV